MAAALLAAIRTLTRIPVPSAGAPPDARTLASSSIFYPLVGALLGLAAVACHELFGDLLPRAVGMLIVLTLWVLLTGGLHEDGLADVCDAFGGGWNREDVLRVLKDSRIGSYGGIALILSLLLRWQALTHLPWQATNLAFMTSQVLPRAGIVTLAYWAGPATAGSGGTFAASLRGRHAAAAWLIALGVLAVFQDQRVVFSAALCVAIVALMRFYFLRRIGGVTGDCLGAASQVQEAAILLLLLGLSGV